MARKPPTVRVWIEWRQGYAKTAYTPWAHINIDPETPWTRSMDFTPPLPKPIPGKGHPMLVAEVDGFAFTFASFVELQHVAKVLGAHRLVQPSQLVKEHVENYGRHRGAYIHDHWYTRMPRWVRQVRHRFRMAQGLEEARRLLITKLKEEIQA